VSASVHEWHESPRFFADMRVVVAPHAKSRTARGDQGASLCEGRFNE